MDSRRDTSEVEQHCALNYFTAIILAVHVEMDLMELTT